MSNAMRTGKRALAGVAAGGLALGMLSIAGASSATAAPSIKPKLTATATATAVRPTLGTLSIPQAKASWAGAGNFSTSTTAAASDLNTVSLITAPSGIAQMSLDDTDSSAQVVATLGTPATSVRVFNTDDSNIRFRVTAAGAYAGTIANGTDTVSFSFTTAGAPASMTLTPATQSLLVGAVATVRITLKDAAGNTTQPQTVDSVTVASSMDDTIAFTTVAGNTPNTNLQYGVFDDTIATQSAGTSTITATPLGTLPGSGVTAATATLVKAGTVNAIPARSVEITAPVAALSTPENTDDTVDRAVQVPTGTAAVTVTIDDTTGNAAGSSLRFQLTPNQGTVTVGSVSGSSSAPLFVDVVTNASRVATINATLSGAALLGTSTLTVKQVNVLDTPVPAAGTGVVVTQTAGAVTAASITVSPDDSVVAKLGDTVPVTVTVADQFGSPQAGWVVAASRGTTVPGTFLNQAATNASGQASVTVTSLAGSTAPKLEQYSFNATPTVGTAVPVNNILQVTYTATGEIASLGVVPLGVTVLTPSPVTNTTTAVTTAPLITVPFGGTASTVSSQSFTVATGANISGGTAGQVAVFDANPSTPTPITVEVPTGSTSVFVSTTASTLWSAGTSSITVGPDDSVYVFATKTGVHNIKFTAGGRSVTIPVKAQTSANAAYNVGITPTTQTLAVGAIGSATVKVTDVFGNAVASATGGSGDDTGQVTVTASGAALLAGFNTQQNFVTNASGEATVTIIAGNAPGAATLTVTPKVGTATAAWQTAYTPPTGAPAPVLSGAAAVTVGSAPPPVTKTITITGIRAEVAGKPGIFVDGVTTGIEDGKTVVPYIRFPGETTFTAGSARPVITADEFIWQRKTGKRVTVYVTNDDGAVTSNRVTIQAA